MIRPSIKAVLNLCLMIAVISMQLSSAHIHVAEHHQHDGSHHGHVSKTHSHALADHHSDVFESKADSASNLVVEMAQEAILLGGYQVDNHALLPCPIHKPKTPNSPVVTLALNLSHQHLASWLHYSNIRLRAPPVFLT